MKTSSESWLGWTSEFWVNFLLFQFYTALNIIFVRLGAALQFVFSSLAQLSGNENFWEFFLFVLIFLIVTFVFKIPLDYLVRKKKIIYIFFFSSIRLCHASQSIYKVVAFLIGRLVLQILFFMFQWTMLACLMQDRHVIIARLRTLNRYWWICQLTVFVKAMIIKVSVVYCDVLFKGIDYTP